MKIVHFAKFYPPEFGGIENVTEALAKDHAAYGHDVEVICFTRNTASVDHCEYLTVRRLKAQTDISSQPLSSAYISACMRAARNADIVHVHIPNVLASIAALRVPRNSRVVVHWHADIEGKGVLGFLVRPIEWALLRRADCVVTTTKVYSLASAALAPHLNRTIAIPIGINELDEGLAAEHSAKPYVLFVGRLVPYKGLSVLLDAFAKVKSEANLRIVGMGPEEAALKAQANTLGISARVEFLGRVEPSRLEALFAGAALFCLPSVNRSEAYGVVLLEAMRAGRAIVATDIPGSGVPWVNETGVTVPARDTSALAEALDHLLSNPEQAAEIGAAGRLRFEKEFTREIMSSRFLQLYSQILNREIKLQQK